MSLLGRNYYKGVDLAMKTTTRNMLAVPVMSRGDETDDGKVVAVRGHFPLSAIHPCIVSRLALVCGCLS